MPWLNRTIDIGGLSWSYRIGRENALIENPINKKRYVVPFRDLAPTKWAEKHTWYNGRDLSITPSDVKVYIEEVLTVQS